jgi:hypothetical protein
MGMNARTESFWSQMFVAGKLGSERQFSLCFSSAPTAERKGTEAGAVTLGGVDERFDKTPMVYTPDSNGGREGFFSVRVRRVYLREGSAGESVKSSLPSPNQGVKVLDVPEDTLNTGGIIVDSGTTDTYWNHGIAAAFNQLFLEMTGLRHNNDDELSLTHAELMALPTVLFQLVSSPEANAGMDAYKTVGLAGSLDDKHPFDVVLAFPPSHYMDYDERAKTYTSRFYATEGSGSVLGANAMMGHNILFDSDHHRIGWSESDCDYTKLVTDSGYDFSITGNLQSPPPPTTPVPPPTLHPTGAPHIAATSEPSFKPATEPPIAPRTLAPTQASFEPPTHNPVALMTGTPTESPIITPTIHTMSIDDMKENALKFIDGCTTLQCRTPVFAGFIFLLCMSCCLCYRLYCCCLPCCLRKDYSYSFASTNEVELPNFRDEPIDTGYDDSVEYEEEDVDEESSGEFEGDFA